MLQQRNFYFEGNDSIFNHGFLTQLHTDIQKICSADKKQHGTVNIIMKHSW